ncbi:hypothetical protein VOLCADRAFT_106669 [Volvox carteri f. nagariensis]|uniref:Uncharacterized protein n=1 Tax=Volvox carteri f. nagariensis TaxID=3068 RepID=D8U911_VOLCA|nr:uncharacterized protein VOLCADRAFT_106669 [Volvox carteri f. nagariensis]EFJ43903.1 hypothetical protein VOLCADRAFT_106669 [Volvox carteri f. nagariensis]|eukprot:XP_002955149.1 hypothetical protein VOLCADRAFT_106669 [Volvox carteri f. nagariensis]
MVDGEISKTCANLQNRGIHGIYFPYLYICMYALPVYLHTISWIRPYMSKGTCKYPHERDDKGVHDVRPTAHSALLCLTRLTMGLPTVNGNLYHRIYTFDLISHLTKIKTP